MILPHERAEALAFLCATIGTNHEARINNQESELVARDPLSVADNNKPRTTDGWLLTPAQFERVLALDAEEQHILVKLGPTPEPHEIIALYNYHSLETALCHAEVLRLRMHGPVWNIIRSAHNLARRYRLRYEISSAPRTLFAERLELALHGGRDPKSLSQYAQTRTGRRVVRALLRLLAAHPDSLDGGEALVYFKGQKLTLKLDRRSLQMLGVAAQQSALSAGATDAAISDAWDEDIAATFQKAWGRAFVRGRTAGWRLRREACPVPLAAYGEQPAEAIAALVTTLERRHPRRRPEQVLTPWQRLEQLVADEGFVEERTVAALMTCSLEEAARVVQRWGGPTLHVLPGLGVCAPESLDEIRQLIEDGEIRQRAA